MCLCCANADSSKRLSEIMNYEEEDGQLGSNLKNVASANLGPPNVAQGHGSVDG